MYQKVDHTQQLSQFSNIFSNQYQNSIARGEHLWQPQYPCLDLIEHPPPQCSQKIDQQIQEVKIVPQVIPEQRQETNQSNLEQKQEQNYKNICRYIERTVLECLTSKQYKDVVKGLCSKYQCQYSTVIRYFGKHFNKKSLGIRHLIQMMTASKLEQSAIKGVFSDFFQYFLRKRYSISILQFGKMQNKGLYFKAKNRLLYLKETIPKYDPFNTTIDHPISLTFISDDES